MALLNKLKEVRTVKQNYFVVQKRFYAELSKRFPHLMNSDMANITNKIEKELNDMLCASLKYNSIKIQLPSSGRWSQEVESYVNVQRGEPGFYYPQSQRGISDIHYMNLEQYIDDKGDMRKKSKDVDYNTNKSTIKDKLLIQLTELKNPKHANRIHADKLDFYFKILKEIMAYRKEFLCYTNEGYRMDVGAQFKIGKLHFALRDKSMDVNTMKLKVDEDGDPDSEDYNAYTKNDEESDYTYHYGGNDFNYSYRMSNSDILRMLDYSSPESKHFSKDVHTRLKLFIENYDKILSRLIIEEEKKKKAYNTCQDFLKQLRVHTVPFNVLKEIKSNG